MKIKVKPATYDEVMALPMPKHLHPKRPNIFFRTLLKVVSAPELKRVNFKVTKLGMDALAKDEPCLILMNHSCFTDLKIASTLLYPRPFNIVCTSDGFVGKSGLMRALGCIPTQKFVSDLTLIRDIKYSLTKLGCSVLMYPEASYSFDGCATPLPDTVGSLIKMLGVPVVMIRTYGAFAHDPLYNGLQLRDVDVSARMEYLLSPDDTREKSTDEINAILRECFSFDSFAWQRDNNVVIDEPFRADGLNRVLYKCPHCSTEGHMIGKGTHLVCEECGKSWELTELGRLVADEGETEFDHVPDWYAWERECVRREIVDGKYGLDAEVDICAMVDTSCIYKIGTGRLIHNASGFHLCGCDGKLDYKQPPQASYSIYSDYFWYEIGDMICIGDRKILYYCFPKSVGDVVAKTRLAAEELYKLSRQTVRSRPGHKHE